MTVFFYDANSYGVTLTISGAGTLDLTDELSEMVSGSLVAKRAASVYTSSAGNTITTGGRNDGLYGNAGNDALNGGLGIDVLLGGQGVDSFVFNTALNAATNVDRISDFSVVDYTIWLDDAVFSSLSASSWSSADFVTGRAAVNSSQNIIYNSTSGGLFYDADGEGGAAAVQFATLTANLALTHNDFLII
jgi:serralysin